MSLAKEEGKSKIAAVLVAVFLSFWTWLYTYKKDAWKFWIGLVVTIAQAVLFAYPEIGTPFVLFLAINSTVWIWSIVDTAVKSNEWYRLYPVGK